MIDTDLPIVSFAASTASFLFFLLGFTSQSATSGSSAVL